MLQHRGMVPHTVGELLASLVERALGTARDNQRAEHLLQQLARLSTDRAGRPVVSGDVASRHDVRTLVESGLVIEQNGTLGFPLSILMYWFAGQSLEAGDPAPLDLASDLERLELWRYPLIMAVAAAGHDWASALLAPLAEAHPAFTATVVNEGLELWDLAGEELVAPPPWRECGERLRTAMGAWTKGIGPLASLIAPVKENGLLESIGIRTSDFGITYGWYKALDTIPDVIALPPHITALQSAPFEGWPGAQYRQTVRQSPWAWRWTLDDLVKKITRLLQRRALPAPEGALAREAAWQAALAMTMSGQYRYTPIPLEEFEAALDALPREDDATIVTVSSPDGRQYPITPLKDEVARLRLHRQRHISPPWPGQDQPPQGLPVWWDGYSDERILERTKAIYEGAIEGYQLLVETWFPTLAPRLTTMVTLPARLVGLVGLPEPDKVAAGRPMMQWYWEALEHNDRSSVVLRVIEWPPGWEQSHASGRQAWDRLRHLRPGAADWISLSTHLADDLTKLFSATPATDLVYQWLREDLKRISWVTTTLDGPV